MLVARLHQRDDRQRRLVVISASALLESNQGATTNDRGVIAGELILVQELANLHLDELLELFVVDLVRLVHEHNDVRNTHLASKQDVLASLRHRTISGRHHQDRAVHLSGARDHVLHVVRVSGAVHVRIVTILRLVLHMGRCDRNTASLLFGSLVDLVKGREISETTQRLNPRNSSGQSRLAMVNVTNGADVYVRLVANKLLFSHLSRSYP